MSLKNRLNKIEQQAQTLPPSAEQLLAQCAGLRAEDLSDAQLTAIIRAGGNEPADGIEFSDAELAAIINSEKEA